jgi:hypothetical protein
MRSDFARKMSDSTGKKRGRLRENEEKKATAMKYLQWLK